MEIIWSWLPRRFQIRDMELVFSTSRDGCALSTLYDLCAQAGETPTILLIQACERKWSRNTSSVEILPSRSSLARTWVCIDANSFHTCSLHMFQSFGAFTVSQWRRSFKYYGHQESFVFSLNGSRRGEVVSRWARYAQLDQQQQTQTHACYCAIYEYVSLTHTLSLMGTASSSIAVSDSTEINDWFMLGTTEALVMGGGG